MDKLLGVTELQGKDGKVAVASLDADVVGIYFSAHWCPPCRGFTPVLVDFHQKLVKEGKKFQVVFVSSDRDAASFKEYYDTMPWLALPYDERDAKEELAGNFNVRGIPTLVFVDGKTGETINPNARGLVQSEDPTGAKFPWK